ncbi:DUF3052 domain-containing protein [Kineosporia sp. A_224]|uniref:DUF3052 domain-containing protein n=1 Tax=Kineosporia sp. A_224 TaxID=1962180 RepID=UPI000B4BEF8C|nr:DUF3052 domain-containing protein [Kineosporia sp. A_224]
MVFDRSKEEEVIEVGTTAESAADQSMAGRLGFRPGQVVQEFGYDDDVDDELRLAVEDLTGNEMVDEENQEVVDAAVYWWRDGDGDLVDSLMDALTNLAEGGVVWLLTPKSGRPGHVEPAEIEDAAPTAGLHATSTISACSDWTGTRLASPRNGRK